MRYQGLDPRTRLLRWTLFLTAIAIILASTGGQAVDAVGGWLRDEYERLPWYVTRITALLAYLALTGSVVYGLLLSTKILDRIAHRTVSFTLHQDLASIGLALALVHVAVLTIDRSVPYSLSDVIVPFSGPYRPVWVGIGQLTLGISMLVLFSFYVRKRIGQKAWRRLHYLSFLAFLGATAHGLMAGTDTAARWVFSGYLVLTAMVVSLIVYRIVLAIGERPSSSQRPVPGRLSGAPDEAGDGAVARSSPALNEAGESTSPTPRTVRPTPGEA